MYALTPSGRKRQQMLLHLNNQRQTRQIDSKKRQTFNSRNEKLLNIDQDITIKKKQKIQQSNGDSKSEMDLNENQNEDNNSILYSNIADKENSANSASFTTSDDEDSNLNGVLATQNHNDIGKGISLGEQQAIFSTGILGEGHLSILHAHVRDDLFKNIKILSSSHLETKGEIMQECLKLLKYSESRNGNLTAFANACRTEIRKTICSRRGYVKRQTGITMNGTVIFTSILLNYKSC